ncbi:MAG: sigma-70 family RNA polymerase sigma factor [Verrucomicrobiota bacterium]
MIRPTMELDGWAEISDETLMKKISQRSQPALNEFFGRYGKTLKAVIDSVVHEGGEAEDVLQEIFLQIWKEATHYSPAAGKPLGWVVTITRRRAIDRLRRRQAYARARERYSEQLDQKSPRARRRGIHDEFVLSDLRRFLKEQMQTLPPFQREALDLAFFKGMSHREIAAATSSPLGTIKTRLELGMQKLSQSIKPMCHKV